MNVRRVLFLLLSLVLPLTLIPSASARSLSQMNTPTATRTPIATPTGLPPILQSLHRARSCCARAGGLWMGKGDWEALQQRAASEGKWLGDFTGGRTVAGLWFTDDQGHLFTCLVDSENPGPMLDAFQRCMASCEGTPTLTPGMPPAVQILAPQDGAIFYYPPGAESQTVNVQVQVSDADGDLNSLSISRIWGKEAVGEGYTPPPGGGQFVQSVTLKPGENEIVVIARDGYGHETTKSIRVFLREGEAPTPTLAATSTPSPTTLPTEVPTPTSTPTAVPTQVPTPTSERAGDLKIHRVVLLQAVEGGELVGGRAVGVRVFLRWSGNQPIEAEVAATVDGRALAPVRGQVKQAYSQVEQQFARDSINLVLPADLFPFWADTSHTLEIRAHPIGVDDADPSNNTMTIPFRTKRSRPLTLLFVSTHPDIDLNRLNHFATKAKSYLQQVYPIPRAIRVPGAYQVSTPLDTKWSTACAVEKARRRYNAERCRGPDGTPISPCDRPYAEIAVGVFPDFHFGEGVGGFIYGRGGNPVAGALQRGLAPGIYNAAMVSEERFEATAHEIGHHFWLVDEYTATEPGKWLAGVSIWQDGRFYYEVGGRCINFMGNAGEAACTWVNAQTWNTLLRELRGGTAWLPRQIAALGWLGVQGEGEPLEVDEPALLVMGTVDRQGQARISSVDYLYRYEEEQLPEGDWMLEALDGEGDVLSSVRFGLIPSTQDDITPFFVTLPVDDPARVAQVRLTLAGQVASAILRSPSAPRVVFDPLPTFGDAPVRVSWRAEDADGDALRSTLLYSSNGGQTWQVLAVDLPDTSLELDPAMLSGGEACFRVIVSDGLNEAEAVSSPLSLPDRPPLVYISSPWGDTFAMDEPVILNGYAYDLEEGELPPAQLQWLDAEGQPLGQGPRLDITGLSPGEHRIILQARDATGQTARAEVTITVEGVIPTGFKPLWGLLSASLCGWVVTVGGVVGVVIFARRRRFARWLLLFLIPAALILTVSSCLLAVEVLSNRQEEPPEATPVAQPIATATPVPPTPTEEHPAPFFGPIVFAEGVAEDNKPINPATTFPAGITMVYGIFNYEGLKDGLEWTYTWYRDGELEATRTEIWKSGEEGSAWVNLWNDAGLPSGNYELRLYLGDKLLQSGTFVIGE